MEDRRLAILMLTGRKVGQKPPAARPAYDWSAGRRPLAFRRTARGVRGALGMHRSIRERRAQASAIRPGSRFNRCGRADYCSRLMAPLTRMSLMLSVRSCMQEGTMRARWSIGGDVLIRSTTICGESKAPKHAEEKVQGRGQLGGTEWRGLGGEGVRVSALLMI